MKLHILFLILYSLIAPGCKKPNSNVSLNETDQNFLVTISNFNRSQIEIGNLSCVKAEDTDIKRLAAKLVKYHQQLQTKIDSITINNNTAPSSPINQKQVNMKNFLSQLSGKAFDSVYVCYQLKVHLSMLNLISDEKHYGKNKAVRDYANQMKPEVLSHLGQSDSLSQLFLSTYFSQNL